MDQTFLQLIAVIVNLTNQVASLQRENAALKAPLPTHEVSDVDPVE